MFVVKIVVDEENTDYKVFENRFDAKKRFDRASSLIWSDKIEEAAMFEVSDSNNPQEAVKIVKTGNAKSAELLYKEPEDTIGRIDLADLGL